MKKIVSSSLGLLFVLFLTSSEFTTTGKSLDICDPPETPSDIFYQYQECPQPFMVSSFSPGGADGYLWTVSNGSVTSGQGSSSATISTLSQSITVSVTAYNYATPSGRCYSNTQSITVNFDEPFCD